MDPDAMDVTPGSDSREEPDIGNSNVKCLGGPRIEPTRAALDFLELALMTGIPSPSYDDFNQAHVAPDVSRFEDPTLTLPIEAPVAARPFPDMSIPAVSDTTTPEPHLGNLSFDELSLMVVDDVRDALLDTTPDQENVFSNTPGSEPLPRGIPPPRPGMPPLRPQPNSVLRLDCSIHAPASSQNTGVDGVSEQRQDGPSGGAGSTIASQQPTQVKPDSGQPEVAGARPKRIIKIKSREAVLYLRECKQRDEAEAAIKRRIARNELRPDSETFHFDEAVWHWDAGFDVPGGNSQREASS